jgi:hypothetical protein
LIAQKAADGASSVPFDVGGASDPASYYVYLDNAAAGNVGFWAGNADAGEITGAFHASEGYALLLVTHTSGTNAPRLHKYVYGTGLWTHTDFPTAIANSATPTADGGGVGVEFGGAWQAAALFSPFHGNIEIAGLSSTTFASDAAVEASGLEANYSNWQPKMDVGLWPLNQASTATAVTDTSAHASANQISVSGTAVVSGPAGFSYVTGPVAGPIFVPPRMPLGV